MDLRGLHWDGETFALIEQTKLPHEEEWMRTTDWRVIVDAIKRLGIRGAPAIGVSGAFASYFAVIEAGEDLSKRDEYLKIIENARPTAVNLSWAVNRIRKVIDDSEDNIQVNVLKEAERIAAEDADMCEKMAEYGQELIKPGSNALTHCNTGFLVTYGIGTSLGVIRRAHELDKLYRVYACEARPLQQGSRLTMWELHKLGIPSSLICDSAAGRLMEQGKVDFVMLGADRVVRNGDTANKVGTLNLAILAKHFDIPFYVVAPSTTFDSSIENGDKIPIELRDPDEVRKCAGQLTSVADADVYNPAFDVTPGELVTAFVREDGVFYPPYNF